MTFRVLNSAHGHGQNLEIALGMIALCLAKSGKSVLLAHYPIQPHIRIQWEFVGLKISARVGWCRAAQARDFDVDPRQRSVIKHGDF